MLNNPTNDIGHCRVGGTPIYAVLVSLNPFDSRNFRFRSRVAQHSEKSARNNPKITLNIVRKIFHILDTSVSESQISFLSVTARFRDNTSFSFLNVV